MNKRYIDFVPTKGASDKEVKVKATRASVSSTRTRSVATSGTSAKKVETKVVMARSTQVSNSKQAVRIGQSRKTSVVYRSMPETSQASSRKVKRGLRMDDDSGLGVIEDLNTKFVKNEIEKRPLGGTRPVVKDELKVAKSKKLLGRRMRKTGVEPVEKPVENSARNSVGSAGKATYKMPNHPFINQEKVIKRPL